VLLSAGVGATPLLAMLHFLAAESSGREIWWMYGARDRQEHAFFEESRRLVKSLRRGRSHICYSRPGPADRLGSDYDALGHIDVTVIERLGASRNSDFYMCGPAAFLRDLKTGLSAWGVPASKVHEEIFGSEGAITPGVVGAATAKPHQPSGAPGAGPRVSFARSGIEVNWDPQYQSVLELAEACDVPVRWSCRTGVCHTCETAMVSGSVTYNPEPLQPPADGDVLICCCRPDGELALDL
jgi:ferredoxin-NADP reductase